MYRGSKRHQSESAPLYALRNRASVLSLRLPLDSNGGISSREHVITKEMAAIASDRNADTTGRLKALGELPIRQPDGTFLTTRNRVTLAVIATQKPSR